MQYDPGQIDEALGSSPENILNDKGVQEFRGYLEALRSDASLPPPLVLLDDPTTTTDVGQAVQIEAKTFATRYDAASYLDSKLGGLRELNYSPELWSWLALFYFDQVCPVANYIPGMASWRYYRHLLAGPCRIFQRHRDQAILLLSGPLSKPGDFMEQLASRQEFITNPDIIGAATMLYHDPTKGRPKRGAASTKRKPGTLRRFVDVVQQLDLTYDLYSMQPPEILTMLPLEFDPWRS